MFQKDRLWKSTMPWTLFLQSFSRVCVRIRFSCNSTSVYEFSNLRLLSWFICLLWFCHGLPKGEIFRTYVVIVKDICYVNWLIYDGFSISRNKSSSIVLKPCKSVQETSEEVLLIKTRQIARQNHIYRGLMLKLDNSCICRELWN